MAESVNALEKVMLQGDISQLTPDERLLYYKKVCESLGLNPLTNPFEYIVLQGKMRFYATKSCTEQLRNIRNISTEIKSREFVDGLYVVVARATMADGRSDESIAAVNVSSLKGDALANALMKAETKSKRRVTLSICGLGMLDESEKDTMEGQFLQEKDISYLRELLEGSGGTEEKLCEHLKIKSIYQISPFQFRKTCSILKGRANKKIENKAEPYTKEESLRLDQELVQEEENGG